MASEYAVVKSIGRGGYGDVYEVMDIGSGDRYAMKVYNNILLNLCELDALEKLKGCKNIVQMREWYLHNPCIENPDYNIHGCLFIIMSLADEDLEEHVYDTKLPFDQCKKIMADVLTGVSEALSRGIMHLDITPSNIFMFGNDAYVGDFGQIGYSHSASHPLCSVSCEVTMLWYRSPEELAISSMAREMRTIGVESMIWSLGCLFFFIASRKEFFSTLRNKKWPSKQQDAMAYIGKHYEQYIDLHRIGEFIKDRELCALIRRMLSVDRSLRPSLAEVAQHPYFNLSIHNNKMLHARAPSNDHDLADTTRAILSLCIEYKCSAEAFFLACSIYRRISHHDDDTRSLISVMIASYMTSNNIISDCVSVSKSEETSRTHINIKDIQIAVKALGARIYVPNFFTNATCMDNFITGRMGSQGLEWDATHTQDIDCSFKFMYAEEYSALDATRKSR